ncbi:hypothetical protein [Nocardia puris]|uniref:Uncharacterized protein n=1 Tax=Nocardia puris TaxID=208602 RepID=A0A366DD31_9NOCA|nr:hypothetical protein [Nocardia puris]RBO87970.1 hypothetical protein DFR74_110226 [Nocardia puris]
MTQDEQLAYWRHQSRRHEQAAKRGVSAADAQVLRDRIVELENAARSEDERAVAEAVEAARIEAAQAVRDELLPQLRSAELRGYASVVLNGTRLDAWLDTVNAAAFFDDQGRVDGDRVVAHLTEMVGSPALAELASPPSATHPDYGQGRPGGRTRLARGEGGRAEAARRFGTAAAPAAGPTLGA